MTTRTVAARLSRLEQAFAGRQWRAWIGRPMDEWPDEALHSFLCDTVPSQAGRQEPFTDAELAAIAGGRGA